jgi:hypothetical protein
VGETAVTALDTPMVSPVCELELCVVVGGILIDQWKSRPRSLCGSPKEDGSFWSHVKHQLAIAASTENNLTADELTRLSR